MPGLLLWKALPIRATPVMCYIVRRQTEKVSFNALFIQHRHICALLPLVLLCHVRCEGGDPRRPLFDQSLRSCRRFRRKRLPQQRVLRLVHGMEICFWQPLGRAAVAEVLLVDPVKEAIAGEHGRSLRKELFGQRGDQDDVVLRAHHG
jgi:hypothetical protein